MNINSLKLNDAKRKRDEALSEFKDFKENFFNEIEKEENKYELILMLGLSNFSELKKLSKSEVDVLKEVARKKLIYEQIKITQGKL